MVLSTRARGAVASKAAKREPVASRVVPVLRWARPVLFLPALCLSSTQHLSASCLHTSSSAIAGPRDRRDWPPGSSEEERTGSGEMSEGAASGQPGSEQTASVDVDHIGAEMPPNEVTQV